MIVCPYCGDGYNHVIVSESEINEKDCLIEKTKCHKCKKVYLVIWKLEGVKTQ